ncbi:MAG: adenylate/guanylate cyclase domain-containing protein, partial [Chloroflexota bacterium]
MNNKLSHRDGLHSENLHSDRADGHGTTHTHTSLNHAIPERTMSLMATSPHQQNGHDNLNPKAIQVNEVTRVQEAIDALNVHRAVLGETVVDTTIPILRRRLLELSQANTSQQRKHVTVLFADVSGFTAMSENMDAEEVHNIMNALWERLDTAIVDWGGTIDKHIGDAVMALFGAPIARENDPELAIRAALEMQDELATFNETLINLGYEKANLRMRIGINTGPVLVGEVGTTGEYTAMGDSVNLASRLEGAAPVGTVLISHDTYRHVRRLFVVEPQEPISVKGKVEPIQTYVIKEEVSDISTIPNLDPNRGLDGIGVATPMIGREQELLQLQHLFGSVCRNQQLHLVTILGDAGIGKSRLVDEFERWIRAETTISGNDYLIYGRPVETQQGQPYGLLRNIVNQQFGIRESDPVAVAREKFLRWIHHIFEPLSTDTLKTDTLEFGDQTLLEKAHFIGHIMGFNFADSPYLQGILDDAKQIRDRAFHYMVQFLQMLTQQRPLLVFVDDLQWVDVST